MKTRSLLYLGRSIWLFLLFVGLLNAQSPESEKQATARAEAIRVADAWLDSIQVYQHIPAISAGVVAGDKLVWSKGYGTLDAEHKIPAAPDTIYSICSISKLFTSVSLMQQWEQGKVRLDEPITTYLPWAKLKPTD
jgi:CubicO group peptidase (beta-lactamase class C family)